MPVTAGPPDEQAPFAARLAVAKPQRATLAILRDGWQQHRDGSSRQGPRLSRLAMTPSWSQAIHMPRWASRLNLIVLSHRIESLQSISDDDACAEGLGNMWRPWRSPRTRFSRYWNQTRGTPGERWDDNPDVVVIGFARLC